MVLKNKSAIITGCRRGIGKATLERFAENGANVFAHARIKDDEFENLCKSYSDKYNVNVIPVYFDLLDENQIKDGIKKIFSMEKNIDILVNNAGIVNDVKLFQMMKINEIKDTFETNFYSQMLITQLVSRKMLINKSGSIINISSCAALDGNTGMLDYVASKAAVIGATKRLAIELGQYGIRVNAVAPGLTDTDMGSMMSDELEKETLSHLIIKRKAKPSEIADSVMFLASDMSSFITGQILRVDGGGMA